MGKVLLSVPDFTMGISSRDTKLRLSVVRLMRTAPLLTQMSDTSASRPL